MSVAAKSTVTWGDAGAITASGTSVITVKPQSVGWWEWADYYGTARGFYTVQINYPRPYVGLRPGIYKVFQQIRGDLPRPTDPNALAAQRTTGLVSREREMSIAEMQMSCSNE